MVEVVIVLAKKVMNLLFLDMMKEIRIGNNTYIAGWEFANLIRVQRINVLWSLLFPITKTE